MKAHTITHNHYKMIIKKHEERHNRKFRIILISQNQSFTLEIQVILCSFLNLISMVLGFATPMVLQSLQWQFPFFVDQISAIPLLSLHLFDLPFLCLLSSLSLSLSSLLPLLSLLNCVANSLFTLLYPSIPKTTLMTNFHKSYGFG